MTLRRRVLDYAVAVVLILIPLAILRANLRDPGEASGFDRAVLRISSPVQAVVTWVVEGIGDLGRRYVWLVDVQEENRELRAENRKLREELAVALRRSSDMSVLEKLVGVKAKTAADTVGARVISASATPLFRVTRLKLDRGEGEVEIGMPVITAEGLVGRIQQTMGGYADVLLSVDPASAIDVELARSGGRGVLSGLGETGSYACKLDWLDRDADIQVGDLVITSGLGGAFPAGIPVGHVTKVAAREYALFRDVVVEPLVDFTDLRHVLVLLAPPPPADPAGGKRERSGPAYGLRPY